MTSLRSAACQAETLRRIRSLSGESPRQWGKMTVNQMVCHLTDGFQMGTGERPVKEVSSLWSRTGMKWVALYLPLPWPKGVPTLPEADALRGGTPPTELADDLERLELALRAFVVSAMAGRCGRHPLFRSALTGRVVALGASPRRPSSATVRRIVRLLRPLVLSWTYSPA